MEVKFNSYTTIESPHDGGRIEVHVEVRGDFLDGYSGSGDTGDPSEPEICKVIEIRDVEGKEIQFGGLSSNDKSRLTNELRNKGLSIGERYHCED